EALFIALTIRDGILALNEGAKDALLVRIGINLGPVRVVKDINGRPNIIGDGINVAQRVMSFAEPNQILVSRSYFEITSRLTKEITELFTYSGIKQDKHVREHEVYVIGNYHPATAAAVDSARESIMPERDAVGFSYRDKKPLWIGLISIFILVAGVALANALFWSTPPIKEVEIEVEQPTEVVELLDVENLPSPPEEKPVVIEKQQTVQKTQKTHSVKTNSIPIESTSRAPVAPAPVESSEPTNPTEPLTVKSAWETLKDSAKQGGRSTCSEAARSLNQC
ncbi:MAG: adenylate/guanylate cyclase domain-containing protein, partial [Nitrosomonadales bacterium]|nr:adenylate/guanylate cyclase domain-containing protein [Nitrosomonadales bacterium]